MTEGEARQWVIDQFNVSRETLNSLDQLTQLIVDESARQNLVAPSTLPQMWNRHIADCAQLLCYGVDHGLWLDVGSGAGLPGLVIAVLRNAPILLVEPRRKRAQFLLDAADALRLKHVQVVQRDIKKASASATIISARAVAPLDDLFEMTAHIAHSGTTYVLPKGRVATEELEYARDTWQGVFHVKQSVTLPESQIIVATNVARRRR